MVIEKFLFPAPNPSHYTLTSHKEHLFWLPSDSNSTKIPSIPCMLYSSSREVHFFIIWCHGNGCDIGSMDMTLTLLSRRLRAHVLIFEYPAYGLLKGITSSPTQASINNHAQHAYSFVRDTLKWPTNRIIIYGHSIGSGAACHLASSQPVGALILQSAYTSINNLLREKIGILSFMVTNSFWDNYEAMKHITCPILFIHGQRDMLIPSHHSQRLFDSLNLIDKKQLILLPNDDHNSISDSTILIHVESFLNQYLQPATEPLPRIEIDPVLREPSPINLNSKSSLFSSLFCRSNNATRSTLTSFSAKCSDE
ncbi:unnamed protein product [Rotaria sordida]|nr:unnamed protein product [Rotaria sordida]CAF0752392.1 unnamed protein product [Rotaria sordida]CAF0755877.1 unnamed protein product [Rotaria sordida]CAF0811248.1 unnamed protein product [Rotaria sordida]CAF3501491.1 unnamed protein product [Rotaria sordida]